MRVLRRTTSVARQDADRRQQDRARSGGSSIFDAWRGDSAAPTVDRLGSGSDYTVFLDHLGAPLRRVNRALMREERLLTTAQGLPGRPWFRHQIYGPRINTGYAAQFLPCIRDALEAGDVTTVTTYRDLLLDSLRNATATAAGATPPTATASLSTRSTAAVAAAARRSGRRSAAGPPRP
jgi:hypothetical protein